MSLAWPAMTPPSSGWCLRLRAVGRVKRLRSPRVDFSITMGTRYEDIAGSLSAPRAAGAIELATIGAMLVGRVMGRGGVMGYLPRNDAALAALGGSVRTSSARPYLTASSAE